MIKPLVCRLLLLFVCISLYGQEDSTRTEDAWNRKVRFIAPKATVYEMLGHITEQTGYLFVYDSNTIDSKKKVTVPKGIYPLCEAILQATGENDLQLKLIGRHILLTRPTLSPLPSVQQPGTTGNTPAYLIVEGTVRDRQTGTPLPYSTVGIHAAGIGTVANRNGHFLLKLPDSLRQATVSISHLGYEPQQIAAELLTGQPADFYLETRIIPLQEVIVRLVNPVGIVTEMLENRAGNYSRSSVYLTSFYREGIEKGKGVLSLTEAVFRVYKTGYDSRQADQVKLLKMRKINNVQAKDTLVMKMQAGIQASLLLDVVKNTPDFLTFGYFNLYNYSKTDMQVVDSHLAHVIAFEQKEGVNAALYKGELYIDAENAALLSARFEINPAFIGKAEDNFIVRKSKDIKITPRQIIYSVSYRPWNGKYYVSHIRGDLQFRVKRKKQLFYSTVRTWFEMATCKIDTGQVKRFPYKERLPVHNIFSETRFRYDKNFWEDFNTILPEEHLSEALSKIVSRIEETGDTAPEAGPEQP
ncbi:MAG: carboxypeptidase-like regulatory domain-containing protein [Parabacteroides sp.]|nr:carboxypeptidase-like regulatory domain-containing protein [Parabacteroides sp.]